MLNNKNKPDRVSAMSKLDNLELADLEKDNSELNGVKQDESEHPFAQLKRMQSIIENECFMLDIEPEFISKGCEFASYEFQQNFDFVKSVDAGIAVAKKCQHNVKFSSDLSLDTSLIVHKTAKNFKSA